LGDSKSYLEKSEPVEKKRNSINSLAPDYYGNPFCLFSRACSLEDSRRDVTNSKKRRRSKWKLISLVTVIEVVVIIFDSRREYRRYETSNKMRRYALLL